MGKWSRAELKESFDKLMDVTDRCFISDPFDLTDWLDCYTDDVLWHDLGSGFNNGWDQELNGRAEVNRWLTAALTAAKAEPLNAGPPDTEMKYWPVPWYILDEERGWALCEWQNRMRDPGTGAVFEEKCYSQLIYGGNGKWRFEADIYNPTRLRMMKVRWQNARRQAEAANIRMPPLDLDWGLRLVSQEKELGQSWSREEIQRAFDKYIACAQGKPEDHANCFTDEAVYRELGFGFQNGWQEEIRGRKTILNWLAQRSNTFPDNQRQAVPVSWHVIDETRGWVVFECLNQMKDPGNGAAFQMRSFSRMKYAGNDQWHFKEDIYDPAKMRGMFERWREVHDSLK